MGGSWREHGGEEESNNRFDRNILKMLAWWGFRWGNHLVGEFLINIIYFV